MKFNLSADVSLLSEKQALLLMHNPNKLPAVLSSVHQDNHALLHALIAQLGTEKKFISAYATRPHIYPLALLVSSPDDKIGELKKAKKDIATWLKHLTIQTLYIDLRGLALDQQKNTICIVTEVISTALYDYTLFKQDASIPTLENIVYVTEYSEDPNLLNGLKEADVLARAMNFCRDLGNAPANLCTPEFLAQTAQTLSQKWGNQVTIHNKAAIEAIGMHSFLSVARGCDTPPYFIELSYQGLDTDAQPIVLVGKGITFDSGGISLKPAQSMDEMKYDMCGAASVMATFFAAVELGLPINLKALIPTCENMPSGTANKPGDIVKTLKGLTVEILNTDAEGRLILCDALSYAERFEPRAVVDVATLTGACIIALGHVSSAVIGNQEELTQNLLAASQIADDKLWALPLWDEYQEQLKSPFADLANIGGRPAGTITAAAFLSRFSENYAWAHLDIAGTAWLSGDNKGATGRPVPLLLQYLIQATQTR